MTRLGVQDDTMRAWWVTGDDITSPAGSQMTFGAERFVGGTIGGV